MKTSLDLPDDLYRRVKSKSALEGRAVREVATALFTAWVDGRVSAEPVEPPAAPEEPPTVSDPRVQWTARWKELGDRMAQAGPGDTSLVDQLGTDRR